MEVLDKMCVREIEIENKCPAGRYLVEHTSLATINCSSLRISGK